MTRLRHVWRAALVHETRMAGSLGGFMFAAGGLAVILLVAVPGSAGDHEPLALAGASAVVLYGVWAALFLRWERLPFWPLHVASVISAPVVVAAAWATGGEDSPARLIIAFAVVWSACFCPPAVIAGYVLLASATIGAPFALEGDAAGAAREIAIVVPGLTSIAVTVAAGRRGLDRFLARSEASELEHRALLHVATAVAAGHDADDVFGLVAEEAAVLLEAQGGIVVRYEGDGSGTVLGAWTQGERPSLLEPGRSVEVADRREAPAHLRSGDPRLPAVVRDLGFDELAVAPVRVDDALWGIVAAATLPGASLPADAADRLASFAALVTTALVNAQQREWLAVQAFTDPLTGLANHRAFHERLAGEVERARRHDRALSLVVIDVDAFKSVNDGEGHAVGDRILVDVAGRLRRATRAGDLLARIGGDEFAWLLPETRAADALAVVERARAAVAAMVLAGGRRVTISAGVSDLEAGGDADELFRLADGALYWSKVNGRDAAHVYDAATISELSAQERADHLARTQTLIGLGALARAIDAKDPTTREHSGRVAGLACAMATGRGWPEDRVRLLEQAALVHDVGKIGVPDAVLLKPAPLTAEERLEVERHAALGAQIVEGVLSDEQVGWIRGHHERPDGLGYPDALHAGQISEGAGILALADAFDVMTAERPYSTPTPRDEALAECRRLAGRQFTTEAVDALETLVATVRA